jgi:hypothetical protein
VAESKALSCWLMKNIEAFTGQSRGDNSEIAGKFHQRSSTVGKSHWNGKEQTLQSTSSGISVGRRVRTISGTARKTRETNENVRDNRKRRLVESTRKIFRGREFELLAGAPT